MSLDLDGILKLQIKAVLKKRGLVYSDLAGVADLSEGAVRNVLGSKRGLVTKNIAVILDALGLELIVAPKSDAPPEGKP